jgi:hypothetical protein
MRYAIVTIALSLSTTVLPAFAQSTLGDPAPLLGNQSSSVAGNAALGAGQGKPSSQELARREQHKAEMKTCQDNYRQQTKSGSPQRKAAREACEAKFKAQRATWYAKK